MSTSSGRATTAWCALPMLRSRAMSDGRSGIGGGRCSKTPPRGADFCRAYAAQADAWLSLLADRAPTAARHLALLAVGGYGRGELCPFSDLDVVLVHNGRRDVATVADAIWYPVWDQGVHLDHSVRRPAEVLAAADERPAGGPRPARRPHGVGRPQGGRTADRPRPSDRWRPGSGAGWLPALDEQMAGAPPRPGRRGLPARARPEGGPRRASRRERAAGHGRLRPAAGRLRRPRRPSSRRPPYSPRSGSSSTAAPAGSSTGSSSKSRTTVADVLSYPDADALMADVSAAGRTIAWISEDAWRRRRFWQPEPPPPAAGDSAAGPATAPAGRPPTRPTARSSRAWPSSAGRWPSPRPPTWPPTRPWPPAGRSGRRAGPADLAGPCTGWPTRWRRRPTRGRSRPAQALVRVLAAGHPAVDALESTRPAGVCWSGLFPSGRPCATGPSATPTTASPSTGTSSRRRPTPPTWSTGWTDPTCCSWGRSCTTSARATPATTPTSASSWSASSPPAWDSPRPTSRPSSTSSASTSSCPTPRPAGTSTTPPPSRRVAQAVGDPRPCDLLWRPHRGRQPGHRPLRLGGLEGRAGGRAGASGPARRPRERRPRRAAAARRGVLGDRASTAD